MPLFSTEAIVLHKTDFRDSDKIMTFLTPDQGRISGLARGAKRVRSPFGASLEVLTHGRLVYFDRQGKNLIHINHFDIVNSFQKIRENLLHSSSCLYLCELIMRMVPERAAARDCFILLLETMEQIGKTTDPDPILRIFEICLLHLLGFAPRVDACVVCGETEGKFRFVREQGGLVCERCDKKEKGNGTLSKGSIYFWRQAPMIRRDAMSRIRLDRRVNRELKRLLHDYFVYILGREIRSFNFLERIRG